MVGMLKRSIGQSCIRSELRWDWRQLCNHETHCGIRLMTVPASTRCVTDIPSSGLLWVTASMITGCRLQGTKFILSAVAEAAARLWVHGRREVGAHVRVELVCTCWWSWPAGGVGAHVRGRIHRTPAAMASPSSVCDISADSAAEERPVDGRVEGSIEALNSAIDRVNLLEDAKQAMESSASRTAQVVASEISVLQKEHAPIERRLIPLMEARKDATAAMAAAQAAEERYAQALDELEMAREGLKGLKSVPGADPAAVREIERHLRDTQSAAAKRAAAEKREAKRARSTANAALRKVGKAGERLERTAKLEEALEGDIEYRAQKQGLQEVMVQTEDRLLQIEGEKQEAVSMVQEAMSQLETLSNELHEGEGEGEDVGEAGGRG